MRELHAPFSENLFFNKFYVKFDIVFGMIVGSFFMEFHVFSASIFALIFRWILDGKLVLK